MLGTQEHYDLMAHFEKQFKSLRLDKEPKAMWPRGDFYENGEANTLFLAFMRGYSLGKCVERLNAAAPSTEPPCNESHPKGTPCPVQVCQLGHMVPQATCSLCPAPIASPSTEPPKCKHKTAAVGCPVCWPSASPSDTSGDRERG